MPSRIDYYKRVLLANGLGVRSHVSFWHETPETHPPAFDEGSTAYYQTFRKKADYVGPFDDDGVPMLDYRGDVGRQYNPIAIAQYGLGNYNVYLASNEAERLDRFIRQADWLVANLETNPHGVHVWNHHFDWFYREGLKAPWYSALAQGPGISVLLRAHRETGEARYADAAVKAFEAFQRSVPEGGVIHLDAAGDPWLEEYLVTPPSHVLNGLLWASWGVYDYGKLGGHDAGRELFEKSVETVIKNLDRWDTGFWSCYEIRPGRIPMVASPYYHRLHITQMDVMHRLTGRDEFRDRAQRWRAYRANALKRSAALAYRAIFKVFYY